ncbi:MAG: hypothetical protein GY796_34360 [Chloroflexi bacterium]|nr:hypothetical protein [Chloroflexota bacterium]
MKYIRLISLFVFVMAVFGATVRQGGYAAPPAHPMDDYEYALMIPVVFVDNRLVGLFSDPFDSALGWEPMLEDEASAQIIDGEYALSHMVDNRVVRSSSPLEAVPSTYIVEADVRYIYPEGVTQTDNRFGLFFDWSGNNQLYMFVINPDSQSFWLYKYDAEENPLGGWVMLALGGSPAIKPGGAINHLSVERYGSLIRLFANRTLLRELTDTTYSGGKVGVEGWSFEAPAEFRFDNFRVYELP